MDIGKLIGTRHGQLQFEKQLAAFRKKLSLPQITDAGDKKKK